jgi:hypothetical protein
MQGIKVIKSLDTLAFVANSTRTLTIPKAYTIGYLIDAEFTTTIAGAPATITAQSLARTVANSVRVILNGSDVRYNCSGEFLQLQNVLLTGNPTTTTIANAVAVGGTQRIQLFFPTCTQGLTVDGGDTTLNASVSDTAIMEYNFGGDASIDPSGNATITGGTIRTSAVVLEGVSGAASAPAIAGMRTQELSLAAGGTENTLDLAVGGAIGSVPLNQYIGLYLTFRITATNVLTPADTALASVNLNAIGDTFIQSNPRELLVAQSVETGASTADMSGALFLKTIALGKLSTRIIAKAPQISQLQLQLTTAAGIAATTCTVTSHFANAPIS